MSTPNKTVLNERGIVAIAGEDRLTFLQGLISNDVTLVTRKQAIYAAFLTPQGKFLHDFLVVEHNGAVLLDCERARATDLASRLSRFRLRSHVTITECSDDWSVIAITDITGSTAIGLTETIPGAACDFGSGVAFVDPRLAALGIRVLVPRAGTADAIAALEAAGIVSADTDDYDRHRLALGIPDGSRDIEVEKGLLLESGFDELNGVSWQKGCYMGQELTARTRYRGLIKRRLVPVDVAGPLPPSGTAILNGSQDAGEVRSGRDDRAMAFLRLTAMGGDAVLKAGEATLRPAPAAWMRLPEAVEDDPAAAAG